MYPNIIDFTGMRYTKNLVWAAFLIAAMVAMTGSAWALDPAYQVRLRFSPPVSPYLSDWQSRTSTATIDVTNTDTKSRFCKILAFIEINGSEVAFTKIDKIIPRTIPLGFSSYNGEDLVPMSAVHFNSNVDQSSQRAGRIPDGQLCVRIDLVDAQTGEVLATDKQCTMILSYSPPSLILPLNGAELCREGYNNVIHTRDGSPMPVFQWTPVVPFPQSAVIYHFAIYEVLGNQEPIAAFRGGRAIFQRDIPNLTTLIWPTEYFLPEKGKRYMWSVRALDDQGRPFVLTNDGWAEPYRFVVSAGDCSNSSVSGYDAKYISSHVPACMRPGQSVQVSVTMQNSGANMWKTKGEVVCYPRPAPWNVFQFSPASPSLPVSPGLTSTFHSMITAPQEPGTYNFSAQMYLNQSGVGGFIGEPSERIAIIVAPNCTDNFGNSGSTDSSGNNGAGNSNGNGGGSNKNIGLNNDPNQNNGNNGSNRYDLRTSYRFIPLGARFIPSVPSGNMDYMLPQFSVHVPGRHDWIYNDEKGNVYPFSIQIPEEMRFSAIHPPYEESLAEFTGGDPKDMRSPGGAMPHVKIQSLGNNGSPQGPPIDAYFNPKEIGIDKSVPWQRHRNNGGDAPDQEFTAGQPMSMSLELMFDMFEEKGSIIPAVQGLENLALSHAISTFTFGNMPPVKAKIDSPKVRYTMFLPDGTPCRATVTLHIRHADSLPPRHHEKEESGHSSHQNNEDGSYMAMWGASSDSLSGKYAILPGFDDGEPLMSDPSSKGSEGILIGLLRSNKGKMSGVKSNPMYEDRRMSFLGYRYKVDFEGGGTAFFKSVSGLESETEVVAYREGGVNESTHKIIGARKWPNIVLKQGFTGGESSRKFLAAVAVKTTTNRKGISITVYDRDGAPQRRYNFFECWPVKYEGPELNAKNNEAAIESLELSNEGVEIESMAEPIHNSYSGNFNIASGALSLQQKRMTFSVPTQFDGKPAAILISGILENTESGSGQDSTAVHIRGDSLPIASHPGAASQDIKKLLGHSQVDINATLPGGDWTSSARYISGDESSSSSSRSDDDNRTYSGGYFALTLDGKNAGFIKNLEGGDEKADVVEEPGKPISIEILPTSPALYDWIKSSLSSTHLRKSGELQLADFKRDIRQVREFRDALITEVTFPALDGSAKDPGYIKLKFTPETIRNKKGSGKIENPVDVKQKMFFPGNFRMTIDGLEKACSKIAKVDAITVRQTTATDDIGDARDYQREPKRIEFPNIKITVSEEYADYYEDFVIAGNNDESKQKNGSLILLDPTRSKGLLGFSMKFKIVSIDPLKPRGSGDVTIELKVNNAAILDLPDNSPKAVDHQVWENLGSKVICERQGVIFQAAKKKDVNQYRLFAEFTDISYYEISSFVSAHSPAVYPFISFEHISIPIGDSRLFCNKQGSVCNKQLGIWEVKESNPRTGGYIDLGSIPPVDFNFFTLVNLWNSNHPDNLETACKDCELETIEWWGDEPPELEIEISTEHEPPGSEDFTIPIVIHNGKNTRLILRDKKQADDLKKIGALLSDKKPGNLFKRSCAKNVWVNNKDASIKICDYLKPLLLKAKEKSR